MRQSVNGCGSSSYANCSDDGEQQTAAAEGDTFSQPVELGFSDSDGVEDYSL